jgi:alpha-L-rhamnosidase
MLSCAWKTAAGELLLDIEVPANTTATVYIPAATGVITENNTPISSSNDITVSGKENEYTIVKIGSGKYQFKAR